MKKFCNFLHSAYILCLFQFGFTPIHAGVTVEGESVDMMLYHKIVLTVDGPNRDESEGTFKDYRMTVDFVHQSGKAFTISGYFAADGDAANTSATGGNKWRCNFRPDETGIWDYTINFRQGTDIALKINSDNSGSTAISPDGTTGSFTIYPSDKTGRDFRNPKRGPLKYVGKHLLKYSGSDNYFVRAGMGIPECCFGYKDFDNTYGWAGSAKPPKGLKDYKNHASHYNMNPGPVWQEDKGKNFLGMINYMVDEGANTFYGVMDGIDGDGGNCWPWVGPEPSNRTTFDVSKLEQWDRILTHMNNTGMSFIFLFREFENETARTDTQMKLFYREAAARFGHLSAIFFVLSEEMEATSIGNAKLQCDFLAGVDGHNSPRGIHTRGNASAHSEYYGGLANYSSSNYACLQTINTDYTDVYIETRRINEMSDGTGQTRWVCSADEAREKDSRSLEVDSNDPNHNADRSNALWGSIMAGGMGVSMYAKDNGGDGGCNSFVEFRNWLNQCGAAIDFMWNNNIPLGDMAPDDDLVSSGHCLALEGNTYLIQLPAGGTASLNLSGHFGSYTVHWLNTKTGEMFNGDTITGGGNRELGSAPGSLPADKVILVRISGVIETYTLTTNASNGTISVSPDYAQYNEGQVVSLTADPDLGYKFSGWSGDLTGKENPATLTMENNKSLTANFEQIPIYNLNITSINGSVTLDPSGGSYNQGTVVSLTAVDDVLSYAFSGWSGDLSGTNNPITITMNADKNIVANFSEVNTYTLNITSVNGSVILNPLGNIYNNGELVTLMPVANTGFQFDSWSGDLNAKVNPATITMNADKSVTANFVISANLLQNGDFSNGISNWNLVLTGVAADAETSVDSGECNVIIHYDDNINWHISLEQGGVHLINGHSYTLSCDARATAIRDILFKVQSDGGSGGNSLGNTRKSVTTSTTNISHTWIHESLTEAYKIQIFLGGEGNKDVWIDNVELIDNSLATDEQAIYEEKTDLLQNYPNPFHDATTIFYQLSEQGHVSLRVYDIYGQQVATLVDGFQASGYYEQTWHSNDCNGKALEDGNYFLRFGSGNIVKTIKLMLMK